MIKVNLPEMMKNKIKISVVVPVYNADMYIEQCIQALLSQNYPDHQYEIIMVDNNSKDKSGEIIKQHPQIQYYKEEKQGSYAARNTGILNAKGDIIAFTDADCAPSVDWLLNIEAAMSHPEINVVLGQNQFAADSEILSLLAGYETEKAVYAFSSDDKTVYYAYANNMATRKQLFDTIGLFMEISRGADVIFVRRVLESYSHDTIRFFRNINVRHLEVSSPNVYFRKQYVYGKSYKNYHKILSSRALSTLERLKVFKTSCKANHYSFTKSCFLFIVLIIGAICYELGRKGIH
jgi:glycosyltransferase involved in cell wall biosynthesis